MRVLLAAFFLLSTTNSFSPTPILLAPTTTHSRLFSTTQPPAPEQTTTPPPAPIDPTKPTTTTATTTTPPAPATTATAESSTAVPPSTTTTTDTPPKTGITSNQANYGVSLELPDTYVRCGRCATTFALMADDLGARGRRVACNLCKHSWYQTPERLFTLNDGNKLIPLPTHDQTRISSNIAAGRDPDFMGEIKFYVGNLDFGVTEDDLRELFTKEAGEVGGVSMAIGPDGRRRGFAFVTMMSKDSFDGCMKLDGRDVKGRDIKVNAPNS